MITNLSQSRIQIPQEKLEAFCSLWQIEKMSLFGSILRDDFRPDSDVDILVSFAKDTHHSLSDWMKMIDELEAIFGRKVDLAEERMIENPFLHHAILDRKGKTLSAEDRDPAHVWDMLKAARPLCKWIAKTDFEAYRNDEMLQGACEFSMEKICLSASKVSKTFKACNPEIPWDRLVSLLKVVEYQGRFQYGELRHEILWTAMQEILPGLVQNLERLMPTLS